MKETVLNVCYAANNKYTMQVGVSIISLLENNKDIDSINIFILNNDFSTENIILLTNVVNKYSRNLYILNSEQVLKKLEDTCLYLKVNNGGKEYFKSLGLEAYVRFFIVDLLPNWVKQVLYLDSDTIICKSLKKIADYETENYIEAVIDTWTQKYNKVVGMKNESRYFNAGVQIINLEKWREDKILEVYLSHIRNMKKPYRLFDQDIMNVVMEGKIGCLDLQYNMMYITRQFKPNDVYKIAGKNQETFYSLEKIKYAQDNICIIHFAGDPLGKPWRSPNTDKNTKKWKFYFEMSPWAEIGLRKSQNISSFIWLLKKIKIFFERIKLYIQKPETHLMKIKRYMDAEVNNALQNRF